MEFDSIIVGAGSQKQNDEDLLDFAREYILRVSMA